MALLLSLYALTGGAIASIIMILVWNLDTPVGVFGKYFGLLGAGIVSGLVGGMWMHGTLANSDPMPAIVGAASLSMIVSVGISVLGRMGAKTVRS